MLRLRSLEERLVCYWYSKNGAEIFKVGGEVDKKHVDVCCGVLYPIIIASIQWNDDLGVTMFICSFGVMGLTDLKVSENRHAEKYTTVFLSSNCVCYCGPICHLPGVWNGILLLADCVVTLHRFGSWKMFKMRLTPSGNWWRGRPADVTHAMCYQQVPDELL